MIIKFKSLNSEKVHLLKFRDVDSYKEFYLQVLVALVDQSNTQSAIYKSDQGDRIFPAVFLKSIYIITSSVSGSSGEDLTVESN